LLSFFLNWELVDWTRNVNKLVRNSKHTLLKSQKNNIQRDQSWRFYLNARYFTVYCTEKLNRLWHKKKMACAPSHIKQLTVMFQTFASIGLKTCHNRSRTFLMQLIKSLVTSDFLLVSNDIEQLVQVFRYYCAECSYSFRVIDFVFQCIICILTQCNFFSWFSENCMPGFAGKLVVNISNFVVFFLILVASKR
jgi:hypothetical protein